MLPDALVEDWPPRAVGGRREGLVPLPAALRRGPVGAAHRGGRTPAGARGRRRTTYATVAGGWRSRSTPAATPPGSAASRRSPTSSSTPSATPPRRTGLGIAVVIAANRTRHPLDARTLARLATQYAGRGVVGFGLSNDERRGQRPPTSHRAFAIAERAGLLLAPHGGELRGAEHVRPCLDDLHADRLGHGVRAVEDPALLDRVVQRRGGAGGLSGLQRGAGRLLRPDLGAAPPAAGRGRDRRPGRRRPAAVRLPAGGAVRHHAGRARPHRRDARRAGPDVVQRLAGPGVGAGARLARDRRLAGQDPATASGSNSAHDPAARPDPPEHPWAEPTPPVGPAAGLLRSRPCMVSHPATARRRRTAICHRPTATPSRTTQVRPRPRWWLGIVGSRLPADRCCAASPFRRPGSAGRAGRSATPPASASTAEPGRYGSRGQAVAGTVLGHHRHRADRAGDRRHRGVLVLAGTSAPTRPSRPEASVERQPTSTGSLTSRTPNASSTPSRTSGPAPAGRRWWRRPGW